MGDPSDLPPGTFYVPPLVDGASNSAAPPSNNPPVLPSNKKELSTRDDAVYGIWIAIFSAFLAAGLGGFYVDYPKLGTLFVLISATGFIVMMSRLRGYRLTAVHALIASIAILVVACASLAYLLWTKPKEVIVHDPPAAEDIEKATAPIKGERDTAIKERDTARQELDAAHRSVIPPPVVSPPTPQPEWSGAEIAIRSDLWHSIQNAMNSTVRAYNFGDEVLNRWEDIIPQDKNDYLARLAEFRKRVSDAADGIQKLRRDYPNFQDVSTTIDQPYLGPLLDSIDNFSKAISAIPGPLPPNYQTTLRPLAGAVRVQMNNFLDWISNVDQYREQS
jgi:hypothetical protein